MKILLFAIPITILALLVAGQWAKSLPPPDPNAPPSLFDQRWNAAETRCRETLVFPDNTHDKIVKCIEDTVHSQYEDDRSRS